MRCMKLRSICASSDNIEASVNPFLLAKEDNVAPSPSPLWEIWELVLELLGTLVWHRAALVLVSHFGEDQVLCLGRIAGRVSVSWLVRTRL